MKREISILLLLFICLIGYSQTDSNLKGQELKIATGVSAGIQSGIGMLFGAGKIEGSITKVIVTDATSKEIRVKISFTGYNGNWLKGSILTQNKTAMNSISYSPIQLSTGEGVKEVEMTFTKTKQDTIAESSFLKLMVCKRDEDITGLVQIYKLQKAWESSGFANHASDYKNEKIIIPIDPQPVGAAAQLSDAAPTTLPPPSGSTMVQFNKSMYMNRVPPVTTKILKTSEQGTSTDIRKDRPMPGVNDQQQSRETTKSGDKATINPKSSEIGYRTFPKPQTQVSSQNPPSNPPPVSREPEGPKYERTPIFDEIKSEEEAGFMEGQEYKISNISFDVYPDLNENSGYYYYTPASYSLLWDKDDSFQFRILYGSASGDAENGNVNLKLTVSPSIYSSEKEMMRELVENYTQRNNLYFSKLWPLPLEGQSTVEISTLQDYVENPGYETDITDLSDPIKIAYKVLDQQVDLMVVSLKERGNGGNIVIDPKGETFPPISIPVTIDFDDERTLGRIVLHRSSWRNEAIKNDKPFPIRLEYIHALFLKKEENGVIKPFIYSWSLGGQKVPVLANVRFNDAIIPKMVDNEALCKWMWVEYSVPACDQCMTDVMNNLTSGTVSSKQQKIEIVSYKILEATKAYVLEVTVRSILADPKSNSVIELPPVKIKTDGESYFAGPIYIPQGKNLEYEYKIKMVTDEEILNSDWIRSSEPVLYLIKENVKAALGKFPEKTDD